ncbi:MAG: sigma-70 family RNA polymerase sigma factor [Thermomicrobiales bacterium]
MSSTILTADQATSPPAPQDADSPLVALAQTDRQAFAALYDRYVHRVYGYCYRHLGSREAAEDATSLVFTRAIAALPRFAPTGGTFRAWLFTIAHHTVVDTHRALRFVSPGDASHAAAAAALIDPAPGPEDLILAAESAAALHQVLTRLTPEQAQVVELRLAGLRDSEIAHVLGRSQGAVRASQYRAMVRLRAILAGDVPGVSDG